MYNRRIQAWGLIMGPMKLPEFKRLIGSYQCKIIKTTKEWEVRDSIDDMRISGFATMSGREVKPIYIKQFLKAIKDKRGIT
jgi:hypothetical protein